MNRIEEDGYAGIKKNKNIKTLNVVKEQPKLIRHRYKCEVGKKSYTFKNKKDMYTTLGLSRNTTNKILKGELASDKIKINTI